MAAVDLTKRTLEALDWPFLLEGLASHARTERGARAARALEPLADRERILEILDAVGEARDATTNGAGGIPVGGIEDIEPHVRRAARGEVLESPELRSVAVAVAALDRLRRRLDDVRDQAPVLARWAADIEIDRRMLSTLDAAFDERGEFSEKTYPKLGELRRRIASLERRVRAMLEELLAGTELANALQDRYVTMRGDRFVVPIKAEHRRPDLGIVHDTSRTGHTVFVEPQQVVPLNNDRRLAESDLAAEERRIRAELSSLIGRHASPIRAALDAATEIDLACARADFARRIDAVRPEVGEDGVIVLRSARHPVLVLNRVDVVANDMAVTRERPVLVLTGPNAGGKTVALKTLGLCALLVRAGCFVPASPGSRVDVCGAVLADIGDQQTVHEGLSSFSGHLATLRAMLDRAGPGCLLLLDELASGTDPAQGGALARALIERFADLGCRAWRARAMRWLPRFGSASIDRSSTAHTRSWTRASGRCTTRCRPWRPSASARRSSRDGPMKRRERFASARRRSRCAKSASSGMCERSSSRPRVLSSSRHARPNARSRESSRSCSGAPARNALPRLAKPCLLCVR